MEAKIAGLKSIIAIERNPEKLELSKEFGATLLINQNEVSQLTALAEYLINNTHLDFCGDATGNKDLVSNADSRLSEKTGRDDIASDTSDDKWLFAVTGNAGKTFLFHR